MNRKMLDKICASLTAFTLLSTTIQLDNVALSAMISVKAEEVTEPSLSSTEKEETTAVSTEETEEFTETTVPSTEKTEETVDSTEKIEETEAFTETTIVSTTEASTEFIDWSSAEKLVLTAESDTLPVGASMQIVPDSGTIYTSEYLWSSSDSQIASVTSNGIASAWHEGTAVITCISTDGRLSAEYTLTVTASETVSPVGLNSKNYINWGIRNNGTICMMDFAYIYDVRFNVFTCDCNHETFLQYDSNYVYLVCPSCSRKYSFGEIRRRITRDQQKAEIGDIRNCGYNLTSSEQMVTFNPRFEPEIQTKKKKKKRKSEIDLIIEEHDRKLKEGDSDQDWDYPERDL